MKTNAILLAAPAVAGLRKPQLPATPARAELQWSATRKSELDSLQCSNAYPGPAVWTPILILLALSFVAGCLFWAKINGAWPFGP